MDIEMIASESGMQVVLDGRIGNEEYKSVYGSLQALQRFASRVFESAASEAAVVFAESGRTNIGSDRASVA